MSILDAVMLGLIQGLTEYLPVSSSAHLIILPEFIGMKQGGLTFDVLLHLGTLFSTLIYFRGDWIGLSRTALEDIRNKQWSRDGKPSLWLALIIATIPTLFVAFILHFWVEDLFRDNLSVAISLGFWGFILYVADRVGKQNRNAEDLTAGQACLIGVVQGLAVIPGTSRSGSTMTAARFLGLGRQEAARFSFLLSAPVILAAVVFELRHFDLLLSDEIGLSALIAGCLSSFVFGWIAIAGMLKFLQRFGFATFAVYRLILALVIIFKFT